MEALSSDWRGAQIESRLAAILAFAEALTLRPPSMERRDVDALREAGLDDRGILEVVEVTSYYNYVNRLADALGVALEWKE